jgi:hypothetical protein
MARPRHEVLQSGRAWPRRRLGVVGSSSLPTGSFPEELLVADRKLLQVSELGIHQTTVDGDAGLPDVASWSLGPRGEVWRSRSFF